MKSSSRRACQGRSATGFAVSGVTQGQGQRGNFVRRLFKHLGSGTPSTRCPSRVYWKVPATAPRSGRPPVRGSRMKRRETYTDAPFYNFALVHGKPGGSPGWNSPRSCSTYKAAILAVISTSSNALCIPLFRPDRQNCLATASKELPFRIP